MNSVTGDAVVVTVELFGMARIHAGVNHIELAVDATAPVAAMVRALAHECPELIGNALCLPEDGAVAVADGYALNRNGLAFLSPDVDVPLDWKPGDSLLLLSNQAGG
jgi:hypothetical protein